MIDRRIRCWYFTGNCYSRLLDYVCAMEAECIRLSQTEYIAVSASFFVLMKKLGNQLICEIHRE